MGGIHSKAQVSQLAIKRAADFCMSQGKNLSLNHKAESGVRGWTPLESEITFQCFSDSDPAYTRLKETKDADTVIQVNK